MSHRLPAYGRALATAQALGLNVPWLCIALDWNIGRALPRVVATPDIPAHELDLRLVAGLDCMVAHFAEDDRALDIAEAALLAGASKVGIYDKASGSFCSSADVPSLLAARRYHREQRGAA